MDQVGLLNFYKSSVRSILSCAAPARIPHPSATNIERLEIQQRLCMHIIMPDLEDYYDQLAYASLDDLQVGPTS